MKSAEQQSKATLSEDRVWSLTTEWKQLGSECRSGRIIFEETNNFNINDVRSQDKKSFWLQFDMQSYAYTYHWHLQKLLPRISALPLNS